MTGSECTFTVLKLSNEKMEVTIVNNYLQPSTTTTNYYVTT